jgi:plasmid stabilization system protein ParE
VPWELEILPRAEDEVAQAEDWYEARRSGLGSRFLAEVEAALERIADGPERFPRWLDDARYRRAVLSRFPYVVMFVADPAASRVTVVAVAHTSREPGYWK